MEDDNLNEYITIKFTKSEIGYISEYLHTLYQALSKAPKNMRTPKFYMLENMLNNTLKPYITK